MIQMEPWNLTKTKNAAAFQQTGTNCPSQVCEDSILLDESDTSVFCGIADGMSGKRFGRLGGKLSLQITKQFLEEQTISAVVERRFPDELPTELLKRLRKAYCDETEQLGCEFDAFASTLMMIAIDKKTQRYVVVHIGDGAIIGVQENGIHFLSEPDNPVGGDFTWVTTGKDVARHTRFSFDTADSMKRIILVSDGASMLCFRKNIQYRAVRLLKEGTYMEMQNYLSRFRPTDDASCIMIDLPLK